MSLPRRCSSRWLPSAHPLARTLLAALATLAAAALFTALAHAGQVRVDVTGDNTFVPSGVTVNAGDQVVWVWTGGTHTVTSGDTLACTASGTFNSGSMSGAGKSFTWKTPGTAGNLPYYCIPHCFGGMWGSIFYVTSPPRPVSDFRINEVRFTIDHLYDFVEIANLGGATGDLGRYRLSVTGAGPLELPLNNIVVAPGGRVVIWLGRTGTNTQTQLYFPAVTLPRTGSAALYAPMSVAAQQALTRSDLCLDYVQWGAGGQQNEATAVTAGRWVTGEFVSAVADGHSIEFCGTLGQIGAAGWLGIEIPNAGTSDCSTPAARSTWGRLMVTYR
jgi:plastocyanin